jgi:hypothetical protein
MDKNSLTFIDGYDIVHGEDLYEINKVPAIIENSLADTERYRFLGWTQNENSLIAENVASAKLVNIPSMVAVEDTDFYAVFVKESVYDSATDEKYFNIYDAGGFIDPYTGETIQGLYLEPKVNLAGKITIPTEYNGQPIIQVGGFKGSNITNVFWFGTPKVVEIYSNGFAECAKLKTFEMPKTMRKIGGSAFSGCGELACPTDLGDTQITQIGNYAYTGALRINQTIPVLQLPATLKQLGNNAFAFFLNISAGSGPVIETVNFGKPGSPSALTTIGTTPFIQNERSINNVNIYISGTSPDAALQAMVNTNMAGNLQGTVSYPKA